jgi:lipopolysaccharide biosynthesis regulator YciM
LELQARAPQALPLAAGFMAKLAQDTGRQAQVQEVLQRSYAQAPSIDLVDALIQLEPDADTARGWYVQHLQREPSLIAAGKWLAGEKLEHEEHHGVVQRAMERASKPLLRYRCAACGFEASQHFWQCPGCQAWDSYPARRIEEL